MKKVKLGQLVSIQTGKLDANEAVPGGKYPFFTTAKEISCINEYAYDDEVVLVAGNGDLNVKYYKGKFNAYQRTYILTSNSNVRMKYLYYFLDKYIEVLRYQSIGGVIKYIKLNNLSDAQIPMRSTIEQDKIIRILEKLDNEIIIRNKQLSELSNLVKSRFNEMFGDPVLNEMGWEKHRLSKLTLKIGSGATPRGGRESYVNEGIALIRSMNVYDGKFIFKDLAYLTNVQAEKLNNVIVESDDVLLNITGASVSRCCIVPQIILPARVNQHVSIIRCKKHLLSPIFLNQLLITSEFKSLLQKIGESSGATRQAITKNQIEELTIPLPPLSLQNEFADFVAQVDKSQFACQKAIKLWRNSLKSSII
ncbi:type I restriction modification DNA specificity domain protein [Streptococcus infantis X]|uniref:Type I restriction modification DNA specificity domain protein n=1 Tax=Streptococcus infantis X TaxID=997830 RepID=F9PBS3_9STRE|nr:type I restriction modification DNA specificity domain protein [Streptococcus infantis X]